MSRRGKSSPLEDIAGMIALLPWWAAVVLGIVMYLILHAVAGLPPPTMRPGDMGGIGRAMITALASAGQYIAPLVCFVAAGCPRSGASNTVLWARTDLVLHDDSTGAVVRRRRGARLTGPAGDSASARLSRLRP
jgi:hypothetical protein